MAIEQQDAFPELSRFAIRDMGKTVAAGVCAKIEKKSLNPGTEVVTGCQSSPLSSSPENHEDVNTVCTQIKRISDESGVKAPEDPFHYQHGSWSCPVGKHHQGKVLRLTTIGKCGYTRDSWN